MGGPLRMAVIGVGRFGRHYVRLLQEIKGATLTALVSRSAETLKWLTETMPPAVERLTDPAAVFRNPAVDAVIIATPSPTHAALARGALQAGKHVLVEKPMTTSLADAESLARAVAAAGRVFMVGHQYCYNDYLRCLKGELTAGRLGALRYCFAEHCYPGPIRPGVSCFWETATHEVAMFDYLFGLETIRALKGASVSFSGSDKDDFTVAEFTFENGMLATIVTTWFAPEKIRRLIVGGEHGTAIFDEQLRFSREPYRSLRDRQAATAADALELAPVEVAEPLRNQLEHFIECTRTGREPLTGIEHGLRVTRVLDRVVASR